jgi:taurine dioxygenase
MTYQKIQVKQLSGAGGAEITGVDLVTADDQTIAEIESALHQFLVVTLPDQPLDDAQLARFTARLGAFGLEPFIEGESTHPNVVAVVKEADEVKRLNFGGRWHSDWSFLETPPSFTLLHARELPPFGGDTMFAHQAAAYDALSDGMKRMLEGLRAWHTDRMVAGPNSGINAKRSTKVRDGADWVETRSLHPVVRTHPETGRRMLFVNASYTTGFEGMTEAESRPLLDYLMEHSHRLDFSCRFRWRAGSLAFWDNRAVLHIALNDTGPQRRLMRRVQIAGDVPV